MSVWNETGCEVEPDFTDVSNPSCSNTIIHEFRVSSIRENVAELTAKNQYPQPQTGMSLMERHQKSRKKLSRQLRGKNKRKNRENRQSRITLSLLLFSSCNGMLLLLSHDFYRNTSTKTPSPRSVFS